MEFIDKDPRVLIATLAAANKGEETGVNGIVDSAGNPTGAIRQGVEKEDSVKTAVNYLEKKYLVEDGVLSPAEGSRYEKIFKIFKRVVFPGPEAEQLQSKKVADALPKDASKYIDYDERREEEEEGLLSKLAGVLPLIGTIGPAVISAVKAALIAAVTGAAIKFGNWLAKPILDKMDEYYDSVEAARLARDIETEKKVRAARLATAQQMFDNVKQADTGAGYKLEEGSREAEIHASGAKKIAEESQGLLEQQKNQQTKQSYAYELRDIAAGKESYRKLQADMMKRQRELNKIIGTGWSRERVYDKDGNIRTGWSKKAAIMAGGVTAIPQNIRAFKAAEELKALEQRMAAIRKQGEAHYRLRYTDVQKRMEKSQKSGEYIESEHPETRQKMEKFRLEQEQNNAPEVLIELAQTDTNSTQLNNQSNILTPTDGTQLNNLLHVNDTMNGEIKKQTGIQSDQTALLRQLVQVVSNLNVNNGSVTVAPVMGGTNQNTMGLGIRTGFGNQAAKA